ncbi:MAG: hypothetical protein JO348_03480 [Alphaproteobacteria bacterium]|nr:hypothetical protein [Alphaproteobacteria bacterium]MBV9418812.1 hypothetical protein [Alphaproteobacteria bacterium]
MTEKKKDEKSIKEKLEDVLDTPKDEDIAGVQTNSADYERNKTGTYGGRPEVRQPGVKSTP